MKTNIPPVALALLTSVVVKADHASVRVSTFMQDGKPCVGLYYSGQYGNSYQLQGSTDLVSWENYGSWYTEEGVNPIINLHTPAAPKRFFRMRCLATAENLTYNTPCAENDNVTVFFRGEMQGFEITATPPTWPITDWSSTPDFSNCGTGHVYQNYNFPYLQAKVEPDGGLDHDTLWVTRESTFWRPSGMTVTMNGSAATAVTDVHYITLYRKKPGEWSWPGFFVLYCDGNMRLIPFSPPTLPSYSYGTSVIIGPSQVAWSTDGEEPRPFADIASVDYHQSTKAMLVTYRNGGTSSIDVNDVAQDVATVKVSISYSTEEMPFCTVRSNWVSADKCDTSTVIWKDLSDVQQANSVGFGLPDTLSYSPMPGTSWFFTRPVPSATRNSAPDIRITPR